MKGSFRRRCIHRIGSTAALFSATGLPALAMDEQEIQVLKPEYRDGSSENNRRPNSWNELVYREDTKSQGFPFQYHIT